MCDILERFNNARITAVAPKNRHVDIFGAVWLHAIESLLGLTSMSTSKLSRGLACKLNRAYVAITETRVFELIYPPNKLRDFRHR